MAYKPANILMFGATGAIGKFIIQALVDEKQSFDRLAVFTSQSTLDNKPDAVQKLKANGVEVFVGDVANETHLREALQGRDPQGQNTQNSAPFDTIISAVGRNAIETQIKIIEIAESIPTVKRIFPSEYGTDIEYDETSPPEPPHQLKLKVRGYIKSSVKRLEYTYLVTGPYSDMYITKASFEPRIGSFDIQANEATVIADGNGPVSFTTMRDVGKLLVGALKNPEASKNRALKVNSFTATPNEIVAEFEKQTGTKWKVNYTPLAELKELEKTAYANKAPYATVVTLRRIWAEGRTLYPTRDDESIGVDKTDTLSVAVESALAAAGK